MKNIQISDRSRLAFIFAASVLSAVKGASGMVAPNATVDVNSRFVSGYPTDANTSITSPPVANTRTSFLGYGYDFSGIGWTYDKPSQSDVMISPLFYASASHYPPPLSKDSGNPRIVFEGTNGQLTTMRYAGRYILNADAAISKLATPILPTANVNYLPILDLGDTASNYIGQQALVYGWFAQVGTATITSASWDRANNPANADMFYFTGVRIVNGDSGSPTMLTYNGQLMLAGLHYTTNGSTGYPGGGDTSWVNPYTIQMANAIMGPSGFAIKVIAVPTKTWTGAAGGEFSSGANWAEGVASNREGVGFDTASAGGQYAVHVTGGTSIKGLNFRGNSGSGFTFSGGTLKIGTGGIINDSTQTQTFNNTVSMYYSIESDTQYTPPVITGAQHWSANKGNIVVNGNVVNNGFQLVVDGARDTTINGVIRGAGGVGKEGAGKLNLTGANLYTGNTTITNGRLAVNNTDGSGTGSGNVTLWYGTLAGKGRIAGSVDVKADGVLAPGNSDLGETGTLTIGNGLTMATGSHIQFHMTQGSSGTLYDQLLITGGNVSLGSATLDLTNDSTTIAIGDMFWLINNTGTGTLTGTFANLANGSRITTASGTEFLLSYNADYATQSISGGNDVMLLAMNSAPSANFAVTAVPEPASLALFGASGLFLLRRRR